MVAQVDPAYVRCGFGKTVRRVSSYAFFEGRPATTRGQWFNAAVFPWLHTLAALPGEPVVDRPIFITGLGRSGTTVLGVILSLHKDVGFLNEPKAMWHVIDPRQDVNGNYGGPDPRYRLTAEDASDLIASRAHRVFGRYLSCVGARRLVDKYPELIFRVPYVRQIFPDARFIFIYRSGVDACQSIVRWSERLGRNTSTGKEDWWGRNDSKWVNLWKEVIAPDRAFSEFKDVEPRSVDHVNRAALEWVVTMREGMQQIERNADVMIPLRYEDLLAQPDVELKRLLAACALPEDASLMEYARSALYENPAKARPTLLPVVSRAFERTMDELGYTL